MWTLGLVINLDIRGFSGWAKKMSHILEEACLLSFVGPGMVGV